MKKLSLMVTITFLLNGCSFSNSSKEEITSRPSDELEFAVDTFNETSTADIVVEEQKIVEEKMPGEVVPGSMPESMAEVKPEEMKIVSQVPQTPNLQAETVIVPEISPAVPEAHNYALGPEERYQVQKGDTLMMIAFKIYGDYRKWKELKVWNKDKLAKKMEPGVELKYYVPEQTFGWRPNGLPYMVKAGDNLGKISMEKYGTWKKWKDIYENNRPLIKSPNLIFAGFTLYYVPVRDVASENR